MSLILTFRFPPWVVPALTVVGWFVAWGWVSESRGIRWAEAIGRVAARRMVKG